LSQSARERIEKIAEDDRRRFRLMAKYRGVVEDVIPCSRAAVLKAIERHRRRYIDDEARAITRLDVDDESGDGWAMLAGDFADRAADLADGSIDLIVTDPPYPREFLGLWSLLAKEAARVLKPQGILVALSGQIMLPEVLSRLGEHLAYGWQYCQPMPGSPQSRILARQVIQSYKPWLAYSNGAWPSGRVDWHADTLDGSTFTKDRYRWQQSPEPARLLVSYLAPENGLVLDPFAGVGTYGAAALAAGRRFVGVESDHDRFVAACDRLPKSDDDQEVFDMTEVP
jgi:16S rRNA G966 N2-methylase RsmD